MRRHYISHCEAEVKRTAAMPLAYRQVQTFEWRSHPPGKIRWWIPVICLLLGLAAGWVTMAILNSPHLTQ